MCAICGCGGEHAHGHEHSHDHVHAHEHHGNAAARAHTHAHTDTHRYDEAGGPPNLVTLEARILAKNDALAQKNRGWFAGREILALNLVGAPGAGKTALLERTIADLRGELPIFIIEGDQATANDAERIRAAGAPVVQLNTGTGCHLDAAMVARALAELRPPLGAAVLIENVGNLVCPALFDLGEHAEVVIFSVTEGEDKPVKYLHMFAAASLVLIAKIDLLPYVEFDLGRALTSLRAVNPGLQALPLSSRTGEGMAEWYGWLRQQAEAARDARLI